MERYARVAAGLNLTTYPVERPFSFFEFAESHFPRPLTLRRLLSQARMHGCQTMVVEGLAASDDLTGENEDIERRYGVGSTSTAFRISFFLKPFKTWRGMSSATDRDFRNFVLGRLPGYFALYEGGGPTNPKYRFIPSGAQGHVSLFGLS